MGIRLRANIFTRASEGKDIQTFDGLLDEIGIYDRALTGSEIKAIYDAGVDGKCRPIRRAILESTFDEGDENWWIFGDGTNLTHHASGGNPGGFISADDKSLSESWWFVSPGPWSGDWNIFLGGTISFDLKLMMGDVDNAAPVLDVITYNIPATVSSLPEGAKDKDLPEGTLQGLNDWKRTGYGGPCLPIGEHRYFHKLYALDTALPDLGRIK
jgi:hypothetical protein